MPIKTLKCAFSKQDCSFSYFMYFGIIQVRVMLHQKVVFFAQSKPTEIKADIHRLMVN